ncbi:MAG TPA: MBL fold metallo-hydrolase [Methylovirgula sp.]|nr:MBL fold metallo-hydrolase [Methylovirgula sp.]
MYTARYGGNSACIEVRCGGHVLIFDAGSGLRGLGQALLRDATATRIDIILSHCHLDHVIGLPYFAPLHRQGVEIRFWAGNLPPQMALKEVVQRLISFPLSPLAIETFQAHLQFQDFEPGDVLKPYDGVTLQTALLRHPGGSVGFRLDYAGRAFAYLTDTESGDPAVDARLVALAKDADLVVCDATFTDKELPARRGWGHSSWQQSLALAQQAAAKRVALFHHDPEHSDDLLDQIAAEAEAIHPGTIVAREGLCLKF